mmetsp:Transcript_5565/g.4759  ORF Transcript_5565/g.4759 Transcript_5565/m.4759 type:complete len:123 (-) Transcript_5565:27-395(-)
MFEHILDKFYRFLDFFTNENLKAVDYQDVFHFLKTRPNVQYEHCSILRYIMNQAVDLKLFDMIKNGMETMNLFLGNEIVKSDDDMIAEIRAITRYLKQAQLPNWEEIKSDLSEFVQVALILQ